MNVLTQEEIRSFVIAAHSDLPTVKNMLASNPALLNSIYIEWNETPLGAASHMGNREIALFLLSEGAPMTICTAAMLGDTTEVARILSEKPGEANARGSHGIPLLFHAGLGGSVEVLELIKQYGGISEYVTFGLQAAVMREHIEAVRWFLEHGADVNQPNQQGQTLLAIAKEKRNGTLTEILLAQGATE